MQKRTLPQRLWLLAGTGIFSTLVACSQTKPTLTTSVDVPRAVINAQLPSSDKRVTQSHTSTVVEPVAAPPPPPAPPVQPLAAIDNIDSNPAPVAGLRGTGEKLAFVVGNSRYTQVGQLVNPANDARDVSQKLQQLGFKLHGDRAHIDLTEAQLISEFGQFVEQSRAKEIALFYFAGHGMQFGGKPHVLPVDVPADDLELTQRRSIELDYLLAQLDGKAQLAIAVFDACREIPEISRHVAKTRSGTSASPWRGLSRPSVEGTSTLVAYSGGAGELVSDGTNERNSPYTKVLLEHLDARKIANGGWDAPGVFAEVSYQFRQQRGGQQPEVINQGVRPNRFYLAAIGQPS